MIGGIIFCWGEDLGDEFSIVFSFFLVDNWLESWCLSFCGWFFFFGFGWSLFRGGNFLLLERLVVFVCVLGVCWLLVCKWWVGDGFDVEGERVSLLLLLLNNKGLFFLVFWSRFCLLVFWLFFLVWYFCFWELFLLVVFWVDWDVCLILMGFMLCDFMKFVYWIFLIMYGCCWIGFCGFKECFSWIVVFWVSLLLLFVGILWFCGELGVVWDCNGDLGGVGVLERMFGGEESGEREDDVVIWI